MPVPFSGVYMLAATLALGKGAAPPQDPAATLLEREDKRAKAAYEKDDYATAATLYEKLWEDAQVPKFLYNAGLAREGLGHSAHALALWNKYLKQEITPEESAKAEARIATAQQRTTQVVVSVDPAKLAELGGTLEYQYVGPQSTKQRVPLSVSAVDAQRTEERKLELYLEPGIWELKFTPDEDSAKVYGGDTETLNVVAGQKTTDVQMNLEADVLVVDVKIVGERPRGDIYVVFRDLMSIDKDVHVEVPEKSAMGTLRGGRWEYKVLRKGQVVTVGRLEVAEPGALLDLRLVEEKKPMSAETTTRLKLGVGLGGVGLVVGAAGAVILSRTEPRLEVLLNQPREDLDKRAIGRTNDLSSAGAGMLGAMIGLWTGAVTGAIRPHAKRAWLIELGLGGAALAGGTALHAVTGISYGKGVGITDDGTRWPSVLGAGVAGLGAGLMGSAITGLVVQRSKKNGSRRYSLSPTVSHREFGVQLYGRF